MSDVGERRGNDASGAVSLPPVLPTGRRAVLFALRRTGDATAEQIAADTVVLERVKSERDAARRAEQDRAAETQMCVDKSQVQSDAVTVLQKRGEAALAAVKAMLRQ